MVERKEEALLVGDVEAPRSPPWLRCGRAVDAVTRQDCQIWVGFRVAGSGSWLCFGALLSVIGALIGRHEGPVCSCNQLVCLAVNSVLSIKDHTSKYYHSC
jgi:hypothetical protein